MTLFGLGDSGSRVAIGRVTEDFEDYMAKFWSSYCASTTYYEYGIVVPPPPPHSHGPSPRTL